MKEFDYTDESIDRIANEIITTLNSCNLNEGYIRVVLKRVTDAIDHTIIVSKLQIQTV